MSNTVQLTKVEVYKVVPGTPVSLTVVIGNANVGGTSVLWNGQIITQNSESVENLAIDAQGNNLQGLILHCTTNVQDINPATNNTSVTYTLSGGVAQQDFTYQLQASTNGGFVLYNITFVFS